MWEKKNKKMMKKKKRNGKYAPTSHLVKKGLTMKGYIKFKLCFLKGITRDI
jgi:hypothetical protein